MPDYDRRADDQWRGEITARLAAAERRMDEQEDRLSVLAESLTVIRVDMSVLRTEQSAMRSDLQEIVAAMSKDAEKRARDREEDVARRSREREDEVASLKAVLTQKGLNRLQWGLIGGGAFMTAVVGPLIVAALTGHIG